mmetsp:Transcript_27612/g.46695  ORF Transcript_27612/g.46695 Transcript_27612/m.46695 type:complete len:383 (-) Transcript_27612:463-1611(-)
MDQIVPLLNTIMHQTRPKKMTRSYKASSISSVDGRRYFGCGQVPFDARADLLMSYKNEEITKHIKNAVIELCRHMLSIPSKRWNTCEVDIVQPYMSQHFLPSLLNCLDNSSEAELEREMLYTLKVEDNDEEEVTVNGRIDHTIKLIDCDCRVLTVEDKTICKPLGGSHIAQAKSEMMYVVKEMWDFYGYIPPRYCGVLHNGCDWYIIQRVVKGNTVIWNYVKLPPTFTSRDNSISEKNCMLVSRYLEHVLKVSDGILETLRDRKFFATMSGLALSSDDSDNGEDKEDEEDNDDADHCGDSEDIKAEVENEHQRNSTGRNLTRSGGGSSSGRKHRNEQKVKKRDDNIYHNTITTASRDDQAIIYQPLTQANVATIPTSYVRSF